MLIPAADEDVDQSCSQIVVWVNPLLAALLEPLEELVGGEHLVDARDSFFVVRFDQAEHAGKGASELPQTRVVGHDVQRRRWMEHARSIQKGCGDHRASCGFNAG